MCPYSYATTSICNGTLWIIITLSTKADVLQKLSGQQRSARTLPEFGDLIAENNDILLVEKILTCLRYRDAYQLTTATIMQIMKWRYYHLLSTTEDIPFAPFFEMDLRPMVSVGGLQ